MKWKLCGANDLNVFNLQDIVYKSSLPVYNFLRVFGIFPYIRNEPGQAALVYKSRIAVYAALVFIILAVMLHFHGVSECALATDHLGGRPIIYRLSAIKMNYAIDLFL